MIRRRSGPRHQRGQAIVLIALMLTVLIGMAAIAIDGSRAYALRRDLQAAVDAGALAAADKLQQTGSYIGAEQAATNIFASNLRLYSAVSCSPAYGSPPANSFTFTVTCTFPDGTALKQVVTNLGPQGTQLVLLGTRKLQLQFARILTSGGNPTLAATSTGNVNNQLFTPAVGALNQAGCGGAASTAITINGGGTLNVTGDVVSNGSITVTSGSLRDAGDVYAHCQSPVPGVTTACFPSGASTPCGYPDVAGVTRAGFRLADPNFPPPNLGGPSRSWPANTVTIQPGNYSGVPSLNGTRCWFLSGGVYNFQAGLSNSQDFVSNELKPPDEPSVFDNTVRANPQFWDSTNGASCSGQFQVSKATGAIDIPTGNWSFVLTSLRTDTYNGVAYTRESAPSMCRQVNVNTHFDNVQVAVSNVPGATSYNIYAALPGSGCSGLFGLAANLPVGGPVLNNNLNPCPNVNGSGCSLGNESITLGAQLAPPFTPNCGVAPGNTGTCPPDGETAPLAPGLPNQNPPTGPGSRGDRANENDCDTVGGVYATCPNQITPGAVEVYFPMGGCFVTGTDGDNYMFSGDQYDWVVVYEPGPGSPPLNSCANVFGAAGNSGYIGLAYMPSAHVAITSPYVFEVPGTGGVIADSFAFSGGLPSITYSSIYAPVPPASRLTN